MLYFNYEYLIIFLIGWFLFGLISYPIIRLGVYLRKDKFYYNTKALIGATSLGIISLVIGIAYLIHAIFVSIFGELHFILTEHIGVRNKKYENDFTKEKLLVITSMDKMVNVNNDKKIFVVSSTFPKEHLNYFKFTYGLKRAKVKKK